MNKYKLRNVNPSKDRDIILEYNTRVCYECESKYFKEKGYDTYRKEWQRKENAERLWNMMLDTLKDKRNIAFIIESEDETTIGYFGHKWKI